CFGGPFLVWPPMKYAELLANKIQRHGARVWLVNTGWSGGGHGVGKRMKLALTRAIIDGIHSGRLSDAPTAVDPVFGVATVTACPGVPSDVLKPRETWANSSDYDAAAKKLAELFRENFRQYESGARSDVRDAG